MNHSENMNSHIHRDPEYQKQLAKYLFQCIFSEGSKILIFSILFFTWGLFPEFLTALILLILLRTNGGGIHCKHFIKLFHVIWQYSACTSVNTSGPCDDCPVPGLHDSRLLDGSGSIREPACGNQDCGSKKQTEHAADPIGFIHIDM